MKKTNQMMESSVNRFNDAEKNENYTFFPKLLISKEIRRAAAAERVWDFWERWAK